MQKNRLTTAYPPDHIYKECVRRFGVSFEKGTVFTYYPNIHAYKADMSDDLYIHELTHIAQQKEIGVEVWWEKYLSDEQFRLEQEIEAYQNQWVFARENYHRAYRKMLRKHIIDNLSGKMYGNIISKQEAEKLFV